MLQGGTLTWQNNLVQARGRAAAMALHWEDLNKLLMEEYCQDDAVQKSKEEFWNHAIIGADADKYTTRFHAKIVCFEKIIEIPLSNGEILEVHGGHPEGNLKQLKTVKVDELKLEDIPVIHNLPIIFLEDLSGLLPSREVKFRIDLIIGAMLVSKSAYRLAPTEMQELSNQLKELQDKGFI
ncbi:hypothetical protein Tco_1380164 [Tanacetum coccineum]